ncbi:hypothetical protein BD779DRAFT_1548558 [Infundibulicybe gibba]|nr:hypothetical protein BD779DRAFT_1548558 [Infundibulicybe gibba]
MYYIHRPPGRYLERFHTRAREFRTNFSTPLPCSGPNIHAYRFASGKSVREHPRMWNASDQSRDAKSVGGPTSSFNNDGRYTRDKNRTIYNDIEKARVRTIRRVEAAIQKHYGSKYTVDVFGSIRYGMARPDSDLDLVILDPNRVEGFPPYKQTELPRIYNIRGIARVLHHAGFKNIECVPHANVPIAKFTDTQTRLHCDINVNDRLGIINSDMMKRYCDIQPLLRPLLRRVKAWARPLGLNSPSTYGEPATFSSYALVLMSIGFMQHRGLLPNLQADLLPLPADAVHGTFWLRPPKHIRCDTRYHTGSAVKLSAVLDVDGVARDWFRYWGNCFDYTKDIMSIRDGGPIPRTITSSNSLRSPSRGDQSVIKNSCPEPIFPPAEDLPPFDQTMIVDTDPKTIGFNKVQQYGMCVADPFILPKVRKCNA